MIPFESLLVKGILVGIGAAVISVLLFFRWIPHAAMSINLIKRFAVKFFRRHGDRLRDCAGAGFWDDVRRVGSQQAHH